jgi:hypothetical protein
VPLSATAADPATESTAAPTTPSTTTCSVEIFYSWKRTGGAAESAPTEVFFNRFEREGSAIESTKKSLQGHLTALQTDAQLACSERHGERSRCVARLLRTSGRDYQTLDFQSRSLLLKSIQEECEKNSGQCISTRASDITCTELQVTATIPPPAAAPPK